MEKEKEAGSFEAIVDSISNVEHVEKQKLIAKLHEIDVMHENKQHKCKEDAKIVQTFLTSKAYSLYMGFILKLNESVTGKTISSVSNIDQSPGVKLVLQILDKIDSFIDQIPPLKSKTRFGNAAFRTFLDKLRHECKNLVHPLFSEKNQNMKDEVSKYLLHSFGDYRRIDYGTGHELNFMCWLLCLVKMGILTVPLLIEWDAQTSSSVASCSHGCNHHVHDKSPIKYEETSAAITDNKTIPLHVDAKTEINTADTTVPINTSSTNVRDDSSTIVLCIFNRYLSLVRRLQTMYLLEPAGSRGVWGLDDYHFLPFIFGSAQLLPNRHIKPRSVRYSEILEGFAHEYLYLNAIKFINQVKLCSFAEHSPMLYDITSVKTWNKVNQGLLKMYRVEVLGKFAVIQHFIYSSILPSDIDTTHNDASFLQNILSKHEKEAHQLPCCTANIHLPSAIAVSSSQSNSVE